MVKIPVSKSLFRGVLSRFLGSAVVLAGFYLLWRGLVEGNALKAVPGALLIPAGLYLMVSSRRTEIRRESNQPAVAGDDADPDPQP